MDKSNLVFENSVGLIRCQFCESLIQIHWFIVINMQHFLTTCASDQTGIRMQASPSPKKILPQTLRQNLTCWVSSKVEKGLQNSYCGYAHILMVLELHNTEVFSSMTCSLVAWVILNGSFRSRKLYESHDQQTK